MSDWESAERAFEELYLRSSSLSISRSKPKISPLSAETQRSLSNSEIKPATVDFEKLARITSALHKVKSPVGFVDYSNFAKENFGPRVSFTSPSKARRKSSARAKELYNEVQRESYNFGVTPQIMKSYHKRKVSNTSEASSYPSSSPQTPRPQIKLPTLPNPFEQSLDISQKRQTAQNSPLVEPRTPSPPPQLTPPQFNAPRQNMEDNQLNENIGERRITPPSPLTIPSPHPGPSMRSASKSSPEKLPLGEATDLTKRQGVLLEPFEGARLSTTNDLANKSFFDDSVFNKTFEDDLSIASEKEKKPFMGKTLSSPGPIAGSANESNSPLTGSQSLSPLMRSRTVSGSPASMNRSSRLGSFFKKKQASLGSIPMQKECHSVEDTLLADEEFNSYTIATRRNSYYSRPLEFSFETPLSKANSSRSSLISYSSQSPRLSQYDSASPMMNRTASVNSLATSTPSPRDQRYKICEFGSSAESSPCTPTRKRQSRAKYDRVHIMTGSEQRRSTAFFDPIVEHESEKQMI